MQLAWGVTDIPVSYTPAIRSTDELVLEQEATASQPDLVACWRQKEPARKLTHVGGRPILVLITESSYHAQYDHCLSNWLTQAGVANEMVRLEQVGIRGNGHMVMLEKNSLEVASWIDRWLRSKVR
ncbi:alpha/beta hydrolase family protein [Comamonas odontotermitis]|uniref:hypothetical protein n=1 Tax=Comamonas odontotermitis TaxID=379895 RepID=UPI001CC34077|nr:hypothetical protein [Comamonas odontotermitis]UBB15382.1 hypothetical protein LAD35_10885 [Comamonas odontotermitis]